MRGWLAAPERAPLLACACLGVAALSIITSVRASRHFGSFAVRSVFVGACAAAAVLAGWYKLLDTPMPVPIPYVQNAVFKLYLVWAKFHVCKPLIECAMLCFWDVAAVKAFVAEGQHAMFAFSVAQASKNS